MYVHHKCTYIGVSSKRKKKKKQTKSIKYGNNS